MICFFLEEGKRDVNPDRKECQPWHRILQVHFSMTTLDKGFKTVKDPISWMSLCSPVQFQHLHKQVFFAHSLCSPWAIIRLRYTSIETCFYVICDNDHMKQSDGLNNTLKQETILIAPTRSKKTWRQLWGLYYKKLTSSVGANTSSDA